MVSVPVPDRRGFLISISAALFLPITPVEAIPVRGLEDNCDLDTLLPSEAAGAVLEICNFVSNQLSADDLSIRYVYRERIYKLASANPRRDPPDYLARKIQHLWARQNQDFRCHQLGFSVVDGGILKMAIERNANEFINDVVRRWRLWLNSRDYTGTTVLDYVDQELVRALGHNMEPVLRRYRNLLIAGGAKHAAELTAADAPPDPYEDEIRPRLRRWDAACYMNEGLAAVKRDGRWGYVDSQGTMIVPPIYDGAFAFSQGRAAVHRGGLWGYIDPKGVEVVPLQFRDARVFNSNGVAEISRDGRAFQPINLSGAVVG